MEVENEALEEQTIEGNVAQILIEGVNSKIPRSVVRWWECHSTMKRVV